MPTRKDKQKTGNKCPHIANPTHIVPSLSKVNASGRQESLLSIARAQLGLYINPNRSLDRQEYIFCSFSGFPSAFALPAASCLPLCLDVARYAFDKGDCQSARRQDESTLDSNDRFGFNFSLYCPPSLPKYSMTSSQVLNVSEPKAMRVPMNCSEPPASVASMR